MRSERLDYAIGLFAGIAIGLLLVYAFVSAVGCDSTTPTAPSPTPPPPIVIAPTPLPTAPPVKAVLPVFELWGTPGACLHVVYNGDSPHAAIETSRRGFDQAVPTSVLAATLHQGEIYTRCFAEGCIEADVEQVNVKPVGAVWFDVNQLPFSHPERNPERLAGCKTQPTPSPTPSPTTTPTPRPTPTPSPTPKPCKYPKKGCKP